MDFKQETVGDILNSEKEMVLTAADYYGDYFINASEFNHLLNEFLVSADLSRHIFVAFLSQLRKHHTLALFSAVRLHHTQSMLNLRQVLESGACAAYGIANHNTSDFADLDKDGFLDASKKLSKKRYTWLEENYSVGALSIKKLKNSINSSVAHSNIVYAYKHFNFNQDDNKFETPYFDFAEKDHIKTDLWLIGNVALGLLDLFYGVNKSLNAIKFSDDFIKRLKFLEKQNLELKEEMISKPRFKKYFEKVK